MSLHLRNGDRVSVIGGGPAGSFAALHLLRLARTLGFDLEVTIYEPHDFTGAGTARNCKGCAGILSAGALRNMASLGLSVPREVVQSELAAYMIHVPGRVSTIEQPVAGRQILSVYRGTGPRHHPGGPLASFDGYLLGQAMAAGAQHVRARVRQVTWEDRPVVHTDYTSQPADLLVLATGVNSRSPLAPAFGYQPPASAVMAQDEIPRPAQWPENLVAGFFGQPRELLFGALVPKGQYLNVSLLWRGQAVDAVQQFYRAQAEVLGRFFPEPPRGLCGCRPRILTSPSTAYYGDRWVAVGDAVVSHLYKDGINSAFLTARAAMTAAVEHGIGRADFEHTFRPFCTHMATDNRYGAFLYATCAKLFRSSRLASAFMEAVQSEAGLGFERQLHARLLWGMLTGDEPYRGLFRLLVQPRAFAGFARGVLRTL